LGEGALGAHEARGYATWVSPDKYFRLDHLNVYDFSTVDNMTPII
jgi:hypothetical protein